MRPDSLNTTAAKPVELALESSSEVLLGSNSANEPTGRFWFAALGSSLLMWAALPPLEWWPLAWVAPMGWLYLTGVPFARRGRFYSRLWFAGFLFWMCTLQWLRLPHWGTCIGWFFLSAYLGLYLPLFVGLCRQGIHRLRYPLWLVAPVIWTGLELLRARLFTGFPMASLSHTQYGWTQLIQISDIGGEYLVSFVIMLVCGAVTQLVLARQAKALLGIAVACMALFATLLYGHFQLQHDLGAPIAKIAIIQGNIDIRFDGVDNREEIFNHYLDLSREARRRFGAVDLMLWPESMYPYGLLTMNETLDAERVRSNSGMSIDLIRRQMNDAQDSFYYTEQSVGIPLILNSWRRHITDQEVQTFSSAVFVNSKGVVAGVYDKMHPVMFGEYIPLGDIFPWLYRLTPLPGGIVAGKRAVSFDIGGVSIVPSICYEKILPHLIRHQIRQVLAQGRKVDLLVNLTNDGWFFGSSELNLHMICGVFRAVESRRPLLVAANTGISTWIDSHGRLRARGPKHAPDVILAQPELDSRRSIYLAVGDLPAGGSLFACLLLACWGVRDRWCERKNRRSRKNPRLPL